MDPARQRIHSNPWTDTDEENLQSVANIQDVCNSTDNDDLPF